MKRIWATRPHWEAAKGSPRQNYKYCSKEGNVLATKGFEQEGQRKEKQLQKDGQWAQILAVAMRMTAEQFQTKHPREWIIRRNAIDGIIREANTRKFKRKIWNGKLSRKNIWIWGQPGIGKSRWANEVETGGSATKKIIINGGAASIQETLQKC
jgi:DNA replication protein DnaC